MRRIDVVHLEVEHAGPGGRLRAELGEEEGEAGVVLQRHGGDVGTFELGVQPDQVAVPVARLLPVTHAERQVVELDHDSRGVPTLTERTVPISPVYPLAIGKTSCRRGTPPRKDQRRSAPPAARAWCSDAGRDSISLNLPLSARAMVGTSSTSIGTGAAPTSASLASRSERIFAVPCSRRTLSCGKARTSRLPACTTSYWRTSASAATGLRIASG